MKTWRRDNVICILLWIGYAAAMAGWFGDTPLQQAAIVWLMFAISGVVYRTGYNNGNANRY